MTRAFRSRRPAIRAALLAAPLLLLLPACAARKPATSGDPTPADGTVREASAWNDPGICHPLPAAAVRGGDFVVGVAGWVDPTRAPVAHEDAERLVFANLYETLLRVTCEGRLAAGLAESWEALGDGRWRLRLRQDARLWDGTPVTADLVVRSFRRNAALAAASGRPFGGLWLTGSGQQLRAPDPRTLDIALDAPLAELPWLLAHPDLAVAAERTGWLWPVGSGPCRLSAATDVPAPDLVCRPNPHHPQHPAWNSLTFRVWPDRDARDLLERGVDLAVFREQRAADYYAGLDAVHTAPLPWDRLYLLLLPPDGGVAVGSGAAPRSHEPITPAESEPRVSPFLHECRPVPCAWSLEAPSRAESPPRDPDPALFSLQRGQLLHAAADRDARALAERFAALLPGIDLPVAVDEPTLTASLRDGFASGYVLRLEAGHAGACLGLGALLARCAWLRQDLAAARDACQATDRLSRGGRVVPLVATRARLAWRGALGGLSLTHDGVPLVAGLGTAAPPPALP